MLKPGIYIRSAAAIAPEATAAMEVARLSAREPDYSGLIPPMQLRRMSKAVRMGIGASHACLKAAELERPDAIVVGTSLGCLADTEVFLRKMVEQDEQMLTPTAFIQSTHNTVAGQIALGTGCNGYNNTIVQHGHSFEGAIMSAMLHLSEHPAHVVLCGGVDELTDTLQVLMQRVGVYTKEAYRTTDKAIHHGAIAGEGAGFLVVSKKPENAQAVISALAFFSEPDPATATGRAAAVLQSMGGLRDTDLLLTGAFGDHRTEDAYAALEQGIRYRQRTGAWGTDVAVAIAQLLNGWPAHKQRAWIITHWGNDWSIWLIEKA